jgi:hypothetical protein
MGCATGDGFIVFDDGVVVPDSKPYAEGVFSIAREIV